jgi:hypothetical protein
VEENAGLDSEEFAKPKAVLEIEASEEPVLGCEVENVTEMDGDPKKWHCCHGDLNQGMGSRRGPGEFPSIGPKGAESVSKTPEKAPSFFSFFWREVFGFV